MEEKKNYHHGDLKSALLDAATEIMVKDGLSAITTRACAKRAGVASSAVFRHFKDKRALMTGLAARGFEAMVATIASYETQAGEEPMARFRAVGEGYLHFALENPELFRIMFRSDEIDPASAELQEATQKLGLLQKDRLGPVNPDNKAIELLSWGIVHGLATLAIDGQLEEDLPTDPEARRITLLKLIRRMGPALRPS